jgi:hypothetical protein
VMSTLKEHTMQLEGDLKLDGQAAADGSVVGSGQYEAFDPGWIASLITRITAPKMPFRTHGTGELPILRLPDTTHFALAGDWGTGNASSLAIAAQMAAQQAPYTIHLGDVYYAGTEAECQTNFVTPWPMGGIGSLTLNSNHEMYSGGRGYFTVNLQSPKFALQQGLSYFALKNAQWLIVGLVRHHAGSDG